MVIAIVIFWALLGIAVFFVAMRGGPRGAREALHTRSRLGQRAVILGVVVLFAFGITVPALVLAFNGEHKAGVAVGVLHLTQSEQREPEQLAHARAVEHAR